MKFKEFYNNDDETQGLHNLLGIKEFHINEEGNVYITLKIGKKHVNPLENIHGGTLFTICDIAAGAQMRLRETDWGVTLDSFMQFYRPAVLGETVTATVYERKHGKTVSGYLVEVYSDSGKHIADATFNMFNVGDGKKL